MFSNTLKCSVTTVAVMAGLLAVAGPAGAYTQTSLGREISIECLLRAKASDEGQTQSGKPGSLNITLCHEGFEIQ